IVAITGGGALPVFLAAAAIFGADHFLADDNKLWRSFGGYDKSETSETFTATCDQTIDVAKFEYDSEGSCEITSESLTSGQSATLVAQTKQCDRLSRWLCKKCHTECETKYI